VALPLITGVVYAARGTYFHNAHVLGVVACAAIAAAVIYGVFWHATLRGGARRWLALAIPPIAAASMLAIVVEPSAAAARRFIDRGQLELAEAELNALGDPTDGELAPLWADVYLGRALATKTCTAASGLVAKIAMSAPQGATARAHADKLAIAETEQALEAGRLDAAAAALECASEALRDGATGRRVHARIQSVVAKRCLSAQDWPCVIARAAEVESDGDSGAAMALRDAARTAIRAEVDASIGAARTEKDLARRAGLRHAAVDLWSRYLLSETAEPAELVALRSAAAKDQLALDRQNEADERRRIAEEQRQATAAARKLAAQAREEKRRLAEEERRERQSVPRSIRCCDGSLSPSCMCGGSRQGCCSHHGGICGCE
jgi:hypothetical protein